MRQLTTNDLFNLADLVESSHAYELMEQLAREGEDIKHEREILLANMQEELDGIPAGDTEARKAAVDKITAFRADDSYQTRFGIHAVAETLKCAAQAGVREDVYQFLGPILEMAPEQVGNLPIAALAGMLTRLLQDISGTDFFGERPTTGSESRTSSDGGTRNRGGRWPFRRGKGRG